MTKYIIAKPPITIRPNTTRTTLDDLHRSIESAGIQAEPHPDPFEEELSEDEDQDEDEDEEELESNPSESEDEDEDGLEVHVGLYM